MKMGLIDVCREHFKIAEVFTYPNPSASEMLDVYLEPTTDRYKHTLGVVREARWLERALSRWNADLADKLVISAYLHDIGYGEGLNLTGFHPLDAAVCLLSHGFDETIAAAVMFHTAAFGEAQLRGGSVAETYRNAKPLLTENDVFLIDLLTYCDLHSSSQGMPTSIEHRVNDIIDRYSPNETVSAHITKHLPEFINIRRRITNFLRDTTNQLPWIFIDVDGTLVEPGKATPERNVHCVRKYVDKGGRVSLVTGKLESSIAPLIDEMGLGSIPHIVLNGAIIVNRDATGESRILSKLGEVSEQISSFLDCENVEHYFYGENEIVFEESPQSEGGLDYLRSLGEPSPMQVKDVDYPGVVKLLAFVNEEDLDLNSRIKSKITSASQDMQIIRTSPLLLEFVGVKQNKGSAIRALFESGDFCPRHTIGIGDSENDLSLLDAVGQPYVVANASNTLSKLGFPTLTTADAGAVWLLIENYLKGDDR
jgi:Cof subfamily protein (haloacid dehalogenase superfamily)